jgi:hypothetical protein
MVSAGFWELAGIVIGLKHICGWTQSARNDAQLALPNALAGEVKMLCCQSSKRGCTSSTLGLDASR